MQRFLLATAEASGRSGHMERNGGSGWEEVKFAWTLKSLLGKKIPQPQAGLLQPDGLPTYLGMPSDSVGQSVKNLLAGEDIEKLDHSYMLVAMYNDTATLGKFGNFLSQ